MSDAKLKPLYSSYNEGSTLQGKSFEMLMLEAGYPPTGIIQDGNIHRFGKNGNLWYFSLEYYGVCGDWTENLPRLEWKKGNISTKDYLLFKEKIEAFKGPLTMDTQRTNEKAKALANKIYNGLSPSIFNMHPYLSKKGISGFAKHDSCIRLKKNGQIVIPLKNINGDITSLQFISEKGEKRFLKGGKVKGCFHIIGAPHLEAYICEGYATGLTLYAITQKCVIICFNAGNLKETCKEIRAYYTDLRLKIAGDNDIYNSTNTGKEKAEEAGNAFGLQVILPSFKSLETKPTDFNDLFVLEGVDAVLRILNKSSLRVVNLKQVMEMELSPKKFILHPILKEGGLAMIYAKRGIGKTFVSLEAGFAVASGGNALDGKWKGETPRKVIFIDGEMPFETIKERLAKIQIRNGELSFNKENLQIIASDLQEFAMPDLSTHKGQTLMNDYITPDTALVILDNLSTLCRSGRENESESWLLVQEWILSLRRKNIAVLLIHHAGKNGDQRGNSKKEDILDTIINLKKPASHNASEGARFEVIYEKSRNFTGEDAKSFEATLTENGFTVKDLENEMESRVLELSKEGMSQRDIASELSLSLSKVHRIIKRSV